MNSCEKNINTTHLEVSKMFELDLEMTIKTTYVKTQRPYLTLSIDANIQRVSLTPSAVDDCRRTFCVKVIALCQAVQSTGFNTTWFEQNAQRESTTLSPVQPAYRGLTE